MRPLLAQFRAELMMTLRRGESVLLALGIPVALLVFFCWVDVLPRDPSSKRPVDFLAPGILALAVMSSAFVGVAIATAFERQYGVLKRIGTTPLGRPRLIAAKVAAVGAVEVVQVLVISGVSMLLGWNPRALGWMEMFPAIVLATAAFSGLGLLLAGRQRAEMVLASANGLYIALLLFSGMIIPLAKLPSALASAARLTPGAALAEVLRGVLDEGRAVPGRAWTVLVVWALVAPLAAARLFRWE